MISLGSGACRSFSDYCTDVEDCIGGNDADIEACEINQKTKEDLASNHGCSEWFNALQDCLETEESCQGSGDAKFWGLEDGDECQEEQIDYSNCMGS